MGRIAFIPSPSLIEWPRDEAAHEGLPWEIWWITASVVCGDRTLSAHLMVTHLEGGKVVTTATISDMRAETEARKRTTEGTDQVTLAKDRLEIVTQGGGLQGSFDDGYRMYGRLDDGSAFDLELRPSTPVLHSCGSGQFVLGSVTTTQYSIGGLEASGTVRVDGQVLPVTGHAWYDRQWIHSGSLEDIGGPFTWFGIYLNNGDNISFWDTSMRPAGGRSWVTIGHPDGTHVVTSALASPSGDSYTTALGREIPRAWRLAIPGMRAVLDVSQRLVQDAPGAFFYTGALEVDGTYLGKSVTGHGFCDLVAWSP